MFTQRRLLSVVTVLFALALVAAGLVPAAQAAGPLPPERAKVFVYASPYPFPGLDPATCYSSCSFVLSNCYEGLTFYNPPGSPEALAPKLATSWSANADATEWVFKLRQGVTFQDGEPFNAQAVKYSIETTKQKGVGAAFIWDPVSAIEAVDDYTVKFKLNYSAPLDLIAASGYAAWMYSAKSYEGKDAEYFESGHCAGTGPYTIESFERGSRLILTRFDKYWGSWKEGQFDKAVFEIVEDPVVNQQKIESGEADLTWQIPPDNLDAVRSRSDLVVTTVPYYENLIGFLNTQKPPLDNVLVRQALSYSFPYQAYLEGVLKGRASQSRGPIPPGIWGRGEDVFQYSHNLDKARELLTQAGYPNGGFELLVTFASNDLDQQALAELWKAELAKLGITLNLQGMTWEAQWALAKSDAKKAQDIYVMYWYPDYISPSSWLYGLWHTEKEILFNFSYFYNTEYDKMVEEANTLAGSSRDKASEMYITAQKKIVDDALALFFADMDNTTVLRSDIKGYKDNPAYSNVIFVYDLTRAAGQ